MFNWLTRRRRDQARRQPFPPDWRAIIDRNVPYVRWLSPADRDELIGHVQVFLAEKHFEGCGGLTITDEMRVTIAAQACVLLLHRPSNYFPRLVSILVYPSTYWAPGGRRTREGFVSDEPQARLGESSPRDAVVLAWDSARSGAADAHDGHNLILHEFAHQLDQESGTANGAPVLPESEMYEDWSRVLGREYEQLVRDTEQGAPTLIDPYGATNPAEFFAVVTETFFERPIELQRQHSELYQQFRRYYGQDPASLLSRPPAALERVH
jgi:Mlc titration factor MtfA (ptsG expression regulator)